VNTTSPLHALALALLTTALVAPRSVVAAESAVQGAQRAQGLATAYLQRVPTVSDGTKLRLIREAERELDRCVQLGEQALLNDPSAPGARALVDSCRDLRATLAGAPATPTAPAAPAMPTPVAALPAAAVTPLAVATTPAAAPANPLERLEQAAVLFTRASAALDDGMARMKSKDLYASIEADALLAAAERDLAQVQAVFDEVLGAEPALKLQPLTDGANKVKAGLMQSSTKIRQERATQKRAQLKLRLGKEQALWNAALKQALRGSRLQVFTERGAPRDFEGNAPDLTPAQQLQQIPRAASWRYMRPGCDTELVWDGDQLKDTRSTPPGC
jgi:hypothetical protein